MIEIERCPKCNANLALVGRAHHCVPMPAWAGGVPKNSDGGAEGRSTRQPNGKEPRPTLSTGSKQRVAVVAPGPSETKSAGGKVKLQVPERIPQDHGSTAGGYLGESRSSDGAVAKNSATDSPKRAPRGSFDRNAYMREYMRKRRKKEQAK